MTLIKTILIVVLSVIATMICPPLLGFLMLGWALSSAASMLKKP